MLYKPRHVHRFANVSLSDLAEVHLSKLAPEVEVYPSPATAAAGHPIASAEYSRSCTADSYIAF